MSRSYYFFDDLIPFSNFITVRCGSCGRLVSVREKDKYCPLCKKKVRK